MTDFSLSRHSTTPDGRLLHANSTPEFPFKLAELGTLPPVLDLTTAARLLGIGRSTAYTLVREGRFPCETFKVGHQHRVASAVLLRLLGVSVPELEESEPPVPLG